MLAAQDYRSSDHVASASLSSDETTRRSVNQQSNEGTADTDATSASENQTIAELRAILPAASDEELRQIASENCRAFGNARRSTEDAATAAEVATALSRPPRGNQRRTWRSCQPAPSRPGVFREGGPIETCVSYDIGVTDEWALETKRIEAVSKVQGVSLRITLPLPVISSHSLGTFYFVAKCRQDALNERLGYNLRESGKREEMEREFQEGERMAFMPTAKTKKVLPPVCKWGELPFSRQSLMKKEPPIPEIGEQLPLPLSFGDDEKGMQNAGNGHLCLGKFVDHGPDSDNNEVNHGSENSVGSSSVGPYERAVRCVKCRAGLRVHVEAGLVQCPACRSIGPATEITDSK